MSSSYPLVAYWDGPPPALNALAGAVFRGMAGKVPLVWVSVDGDDENRAEPPAILADWLEENGAELSGFGVALPAGAEIRFHAVQGGAVAFNRSTEDASHDLGESEVSMRKSMIETFLVALCRSGEAAGAWSSALPEDEAEAALAQLSAAMEARQPGGSLPFSAIAGEASDICIWQGTVGADLAPTSVDGMLGVWQAR